MLISDIRRPTWSTGSNRAINRPLLIWEEKHMAEASAAVVGTTGWRAISRYQWLVFVVVWAGWTLDAADFGLYSLVLRPALTELLGFSGTLAPEQLAQLGKVGGLLAMSGLLGWAAGGFIFGIIADYIGRVRALMFSIIIFSVFTALQ